MMHHALDPNLGWILLGLTVWLAVIAEAVAVTVRARSWSPGRLGPAGDSVPPARGS
ncbi:hypothetical protein EV648_102638 [Kribbella sp. VKM Ac-2568]|nr:hypothetical protein EV648_102638 [Kribbella sp. VKM Ac-2568]